MARRDRKYHGRGRTLYFVDVDYDYSGVVAGCRITKVYASRFQAKKLIHYVRGSCFEFTAARISVALQHDLVDTGWMVTRRFSPVGLRPK